MATAPSSSTAPPPALPGAIRLLFIAGIVLPLVIFAVAAYLNFRVLEDEVQRRAVRGAEVVREHALRAFASYELILDQVQRRTEGRSWPALADAADVHAELRAMDERSEETASVFALSRDGRRWVSSRQYPMPEIDGADRDYFQHFRDGGSGLFISKAAAGRLSGDAFFAVARELRPGRPFDGVAGVSVRIDYFLDVYRKLVENPEDIVGMVRADGAMLVRYPNTIETGYVLPPHAGILQAIRHADSGFFRAQARVDGVDRVYAYNRLGTYPVYVSYGLSRSAVWMPWRRNVAVFALVTAAVIALLTLATYQAAQRFHREREAIEQWAHELERRQQTEAALRHSQRLEALGKLTGGVAHDFGNLLQVLRANVAVLRRTGGVAQASVGAIERAVDQGARLTRQLLAFSRQQTLAPERIAPGPFLDALSALLRQSLENVSLDVAAEPGVRDIHADPHELELALLNLAINARDAMPRGGTLSIRAANGTGDRPAALRADGDYVVLRCRDTGTGMSPAVQDRLFEPFFTTKPEGSGTGLGLSQVYGFVTQSGGTVMVESTEGAGTEFALWLPAADAKTAENLPVTEDRFAG